MSNSKNIDMVFCDNNLWGNRFRKYVIWIEEWALKVINGNNEWSRKWLKIL